MSSQSIQLGLIGAGGNMRARHIPGFQEIDGIELTAVCNRRRQSTETVAKEYGIARTYRYWQEVVDDKDIDAVVIGTWPYLHCPITVAALQAGKHVLTEARMAMNAAEAHQMLDESTKHPDLVTQIVPSPFGLKGDAYVKKLLAEGFLGELREVHVYGRNAALADPASPLSWRQDASLSGLNMLTLGIVHETLMRWVAPVKQIMAQVHAFMPSRIDPESGVRRQVGTPDTVQVLAILEDGVRASYHFSGVTPYGQGSGIHLFGTSGALFYDLTNDRIHAASRSLSHDQAAASEMNEMPIPSEMAGGWNVEGDFIDSIRHGHKIEFTDFESGVAYMEFTEAVARSAELGEAVELPLDDFID